MRKNHYGKALFSPRERCFFPPLNKRNTRDKAKGLRITSERHIGELGVRCLSTLKRGQDSAATVSNIGMKAKQYEFALKPVLLYTHHQWLHKLHLHTLQSNLPTTYHYTPKT